MSARRLIAAVLATALLTATAHADKSADADAMAMPLARCAGTLRALADSPATAAADERSYIRDKARGFAASAAYLWALEAAAEGKRVTLGAMMDSVVTPIADDEYRRSSMLLEKEDPQFLADTQACADLHDFAVTVVTAMRKDFAITSK